jgi:hypothetical protein
MLNHSSVFETTIRYIGGLLSAYELGGKSNKALVNKAQQVADKLTQAWTGVRLFSLIVPFWYSEH